MENLEELGKRAEIEMGKLGVAEDLGWGVAIFAAISAYLKWNNGWLAFGALIGVYLLVTYPYRKREDAASDAYQRASETGKYYRPPECDDA